MFAISVCSSFQFDSVHLACKRFEIESKLKKMKNFPMTLSTYANTLKNNANEFDAGRGVEHEKNGKFHMKYFRGIFSKLI